jgi:hypothetical protein
MQVGKEMKQGAEDVILEKFGCKANISVLQCPAICAGSSLM